MGKYRIEDWYKLEDQIKLKNKIEPYYDEIVQYVIEKASQVVTLTKGKQYYRSRLIDINCKDFRGFKGDVDGFYGFDEENSLAPKAEQVKEGGRANEIGESVLYIAEDIYTAIAEQRPGRRQNISVAEVELLQDIKVVEFIYNEPYPRGSIEAIKHEIDFSFYLPVNKYKGDYLVTQYICKKVKIMGFDGVKFSSSLSEMGKNIVIFNPESKAKANNSKLYQVQSVLYYAEEQLPRRNNEKVLPKSIT